MYTRALRLLSASLFAMLFAAPVLAQDQPGPDAQQEQPVVEPDQVAPDQDAPDQAAPEQVAPEQPVQHGFSRVPERQAGLTDEQRHRLEQFEDELFDKLNLDDDQAAAIESYFNDVLAEPEQMTPEEQRQQRLERSERMRELVDEMRDAQRNQDRDRAMQLREEISKLRQRSAGRPSMQQLVDNIRGKLDEDQLPKFDRIVADYSDLLREPEQPEVVLRRYHRAAQLIGPSPEQQTQIRDIIVEATRNIRTPEREGGDTAEYLKSVKDDIIGVLDDQQAARFEEKLAELERSEQGHQRGGRRFGRGHRPQQVQPEQNAQQPDEEVDQSSGDQYDEGDATDAGNNDEPPDE